MKYETQNVWLILQISKTSQREQQKQWMTLWSLALIFKQRRANALMIFDDCCGNNNRTEVDRVTLVYLSYLGRLIRTESDERSGNNACVSRQKPFLPLFDIFKWAALEVMRHSVEQNTPNTLTLTHKHTNTHTHTHTHTHNTLTLTHKHTNTQTHTRSPLNSYRLLIQISLLSFILASNSKY